MNPQMNADKRRLLIGLMGHR